MKRHVTTLILPLAMATAITACGTPSSNPSSLPQKQGTHFASTGATDSPIQLVPFQSAASAGIDVEVPKGWLYTRVRGGDYAGWKFSNPSLPHEQELIITSSCVGCYLDANGQATPATVIPQADEHVQTTLHTANSVTYTFTQPSNPFSGHGVLITSSDKSGYAYVETMFPSNQGNAATHVMSHFQLNR